MRILANYMFIVECGFSMKIVSVHQEIKINSNFVAQNSGNNSLGSAMIKNPETDFHTASFPAGVQVLFSALFKRPVECLGLYWILELLWNLCASYALLHLNSPVSTCCVHPVILAISWNRLEDTLSYFCSYLDHIFLIFFLVKSLKESGSVARSGFHRETEAYQNHQLDLETRFKANLYFLPVLCMINLMICICSPDMTKIKVAFFKGRWYFFFSVDQRQNMT